MIISHIYYNIHTIIHTFIIIILLYVCLLLLFHELDIYLLMLGMTLYWLIQVLLLSIPDMYSYFFSLAGGRRGSVTHTCSYCYTWSYTVLYCGTLGSMLLYFHFQFI